MYIYIYLFQMNFVPLSPSYSYFQQIKSGNFVNNLNVFPTVTNLTHQQNFEHSTCSSLYNDEDTQID